MDEIKETIKRALQCYRGDDLARAELAFGGLSSGEMGEKHGHSGRTRQEWLDEYRAQDAKVARALRWAEGQSAETPRGLTDDERECCKVIETGGDHDNAVDRLLAIIERLTGESCAEEEGEG